MKRLLPLLLVLIALGAAAYFLSPKDQNTSLTGTDRDFAFPADQMSKVTLERIDDGNVITFTKNNGGEWFINDKYLVSHFIIPQITKTIEKLKIQNIPSKAETKAILKNMDDVGIKVKVYDRSGEEVRSFRLGLESYDESGTAFLMDGSSQPYNMYISGFDGDIRSRFNQTVDNYRDRQLFRIDPSDIKTLGVKYHKDQKESFKIEKSGSTYKVGPLSQYIEPSTKEVDPSNAKAYLDLFTRIYGEDYDNKNARRDSIVQLVPWATIAVEDLEGDIVEVDFFPFRDLLLKNANTIDLEDNAKVERFFANRKTATKHDLIVAQNRNIKQLFRGYEYFLKN